MNDSRRNLILKILKLLTVPFVVTIHETLKLLVKMNWVIENSRT